MSNCNPLISIIVPIYQVEAYLPACLDSILSQTLTDFELILVDDGSTDRGLEICQKYAQEDERIVLIHQENQGLSAARNRGLDIVRGEYITMVDSDDVLVTENYLQYLYDALVENQAQISVCGLMSYSPESVYKEDAQSEQIVMDGKEYWKFSYPGFYTGCAYAKLYHHSLFKTVRYPIGRKIEDQAVIHELVYPCERIVYINKNMYGYRYVSGSIMNRGDVELINDIIQAFEDRRTYFLKHGEEELAKYTEIIMLMHLDEYKRTLEKMNKN